MMTCYCGTRGIGKTYAVSKLIRQKKKQGFFVITNMQHEHADVILKPDPQNVFDVISEVLIFKNQGFETCDLDPKYKHTGILIVIDEAHLYFNADTWKDRYKGEQGQAIMNFLSQARKIDCHCVLTVQDPSKLDKNFRRYTEEFFELKPVIGLRYWKKIKHPSKECYTREMRYLLPIAYKIEHKLRPEQPYFSVQRYDDPSGFGTRVRVGFTTFGWLDSEPYNLYHSKELIGVNLPKSSNKYPILSSFIYKKYAKPPKFPTFARIFRALRRKPTRSAFSEQDLPVRSAPEFGKKEVTKSDESEGVDKFGFS